MPTRQCVNADFRSPFARAEAAPEVHRIERPFGRFLFDANTMALVRADDERLWRAYERPDGKPLPPLGPLGVPTRPDFPPPSEPDAGPRHITLLVCAACNLACTYCYVRRQRDRIAGDGMMDAGTARCAIDLIPRDGRSVIVSLFGGEPLLNVPCVKAATEYATARAAEDGTQAKLHLTTNGTLLDREVAAWLAGNGFSLIVSVDGPAAAHDANRPDRVGRGTWQRVMAGLGALRVAYPAGRPLPATLRATYPPERPHVLEVVRHLNVLCRAGLGRNVSVEPAGIGERDCAGGGRTWTREALARARVAHEAATDWWIAEALEGRHPLLHGYDVFLRRLLYAIPAPTECGAGWGYLTVDWRGDVYACHRTTGTRVGSLHDGFDAAARERWRDNRHAAREPCRTCAIRNVCGGGCRADSLAYGDGGIGRAWHVRCEHNRTLFDQCLRIMATVPLETLVRMLPRRRATQTEAAP